MRLIALLSALLLTSPAAAEIRQHGNIIFEPPKDWDFGGLADNGAQILFSDLPDDACEFCRIQIGLSVTGTTDVMKVLSDPTLMFDADDLEDGTPEILSGPELVVQGTRKFGMVGQKLDDMIQIIIAVPLKDRVELFAMQSRDDDPETQQFMLNYFQTKVVPMVMFARYASEGGKPPMDPPEPGDLEGLYRGWWMGTTFGLDMMMQMTIEMDFFTFWPDGTFYDGTPPAGLLPFDKAAATAMGDMNWGSYRVTETAVLLSYASGEREEMNRTELGFECGVSGDCIPQETLPDGAKIEGVVENFFYTGFSPGSGMSGGISNSSTLTFLPDGRWTRESFTGASADFDAGGGYAMSGDDSQYGTYRIEAGVLIRSFADGSPDQRDVIYNDPEGVWIGSSPLEGRMIP